MPAVSVLPPVAAPVDAVLLDRFARGDRSALDELFRRYRAVAYRVAYRLLGREADALDAVQDGFIKALTHLTRFRGRSSFKTWLLRIVSNAALDVGRQRHRDGWNNKPAAPPPDRGPVEDPAPAAGRPPGARVRLGLRTRHFVTMLEQRAQLDGLTGLANRGSLEDRLPREWEACRRRGTAGCRPPARPPGAASGSCRPGYCRH